MQAYIPDRVEQLINELQNTKVDKPVLKSEIKHLKELLAENKDFSSEEFRKLSNKLDDMQREIDNDKEALKRDFERDNKELLLRIDKNSDSLTNVYKWFAGIMITLFLSFVGTASFFIKSASDISNQLIVHSEKIQEVKSDLKEARKRHEQRIRNLIAELPSDKTSKSSKK